MKDKKIIFALLIAVFALSVFMFSGCGDDSSVSLQILLVLQAQQVLQDLKDRITLPV